MTYNNDSKINLLRISIENWNIENSIVGQYRDPICTQYTTCLHFILLAIVVITMFFCLRTFR